MHLTKVLEDALSNSSHVERDGNEQPGPGVPSDEIGTLVRLRGIYLEIGIANKYLDYKKPIQNWNWNSIIFIQKLKWRKFSNDIELNYFLSIKFWVKQ